MAKKKKTTEKVEKIQVISNIICNIGNLVLSSGEVVEISKKELEIIKNTETFKKGKIKIL